MNFSENAKCWLGLIIILTSTVSVNVFKMADGNQPITWLLIFFAGIAPVYKNILSDIKNKLSGMK